MNDLLLPASLSSFTLNPIPPYCLRSTASASILQTCPTQTRLGVLSLTLCLAENALASNLVMASSFYIVHVLAHMLSLQQGLS